MNNKSFLHIPPTCYLFLDRADGKGGAFFKATCTKCPDMGLECMANGNKINCFNRDNDGWLMLYEETNMELEAMVLAMNGEELLKEWKDMRNGRAGS